MYIRASSGLGCRSVEVNLAERGQRRVEGPPLAGSNSDSIPMSIPTSSHYIERETKTTAIPPLLFCTEQEESFEEPALLGQPYQAHLTAHSSSRSKDSGPSVIRAVPNP